MKSLFTTDGLTEIHNRIKNLNAETPAQWGKMNVAQMLKHCQIPLEIACGKFIPKQKVGFFKKLLFSTFKSTLYNDKPWKKNLPTGTDFIISDEKKFETESKKLQGLVNEFHELKTKTQWDPHPIFGKLSPEQWGKSQYKHLDHHLKQFGV